MSSVSAVYEDPSGSPPHCVRVRYDWGTAQFRFYDRGAAEDFREHAVAPPDNLDAALAAANLVLEGEHDGRHPTAVHALAELSTAVEHRLRELGRA